MEQAPQPQFSDNFENAELPPDQQVFVDGFRNRFGPDARISSPHDPDNTYSPEEFMRFCRDVAGLDAKGTMAFFRLGLERGARIVVPDPEETT